MSSMQRAINVELSPTLPRSKLALFFANLDELMEENYSRKYFEPESCLGLGPLSTASESHGVEGGDGVRRRATAVFFDADALEGLPDRS
jgi:hypothetical protein